MKIARLQGGIYKKDIVQIISDMTMEEVIQYYGQGFANECVIIDDSVGYDHIYRVSNCQFYDRTLFSDIPSTNRMKRVEDYLLTMSAGNLLSDDMVNDVLIIQLIVGDVFMSSIDSSKRGSIHQKLESAGKFEVVDNPENNIL